MDSLGTKQRCRVAKNQHKKTQRISHINERQTTKAFRGTNQETEQLKQSYSAVLPWEPALGLTQRHPSDDTVGYGKVLRAGADSCQQITSFM